MIGFVYLFLIGFIRNFADSLCVSQCASNEYSNGTNCQQCDGSCASCISLSVCQTCVSGNYLLNGSCSPNCLGLQGYFQDNTDLHCQPCNICNFINEAQYSPSPCTLLQVCRPMISFLSLTLETYFRTLFVKMSPFVRWINIKFLLPQIPAIVVAKLFPLLVELGSSSYQQQRHQTEFVWIALLVRAMLT